jgi:hypothetical protein
MDLTLKNDDSGSMKYVVACQKEFCDSTSEGGSLTINEEDLKKFEGAEIKDVTFKKGDAEYQGKEVKIPFKSLKEFNDIMTSMSESDEETEDSTTQIMKAVRSDSKVSLSMPADKENYDNIKSNIQFIDYNITIKIDGKVLNNNADEYNEKEKTLTWKATTILKDGITLEYETSNTLFTPLNMVIGVGILLIITVVVGLLVTKKGKKTVTTTPTEPVTITEQPSVQEVVEPTVEQPVQPTEPVTPEVVEPTTTTPEVTEPTDSNNDQINQ